MSVKGDKEVIKEIKKIRRKAPEAVASAIWREGLAIFAESQRRVPVDTGRLRSSGVVAPRQSRAGTLSQRLRDFKLVIGYGVKYALPVHERHDTLSKFLEAPFREAEGGMLQRIAQNAKRAFRKRSIALPTPVRGSKL